MLRSSSKALALILLSSPALADPTFESRIGDISHQYVGGWEHFVGGGVAAFDCNNDQMAELFVAGGENPTKLLSNTTSGQGADVSFADITPDHLKITAVTGAYPIDIDSDGNTDLVVLRAGENQILRGLGECSFEEFTSLELAPEDKWTTAFSATWEGDNKLPTFAFGNYVDRTDEDGPFEACDSNTLYRPIDGSYAEPTILEPGYCALSVLFSDWGRKGKQDLRISNDRHYYVKNGHEQLWALNDTPALYTEEQGWIKHQLWGMGIASRDIDGDGLPEVYLTSMGDQKLQKIEADGEKPTYRNAEYAKGITTHRPYKGDDGRPSTGWHVAFGDIQNDGLNDLFVAKGNVDQMIGAAMADPNSLLIQQVDGSFKEFGGVAGVGSDARSRGAALVDLNMDGLLDLVVVNRRADLEIYENTTPVSYNWASLVVKQTSANTNAVGAWIEIRLGEKVVAREITVGGGHASGTLAPQHFGGLNESKLFDVRVIWPDGRVSDWTTLSGNKTWTLTREGNEFSATSY